MAVQVDIPGVGNVIAKNAAQEDTLKEILKALKSGRGGGSGGGAGAGAGGGAGGVGPEMKKAKIEDFKAAERQRQMASEKHARDQGELLRRRLRSGCMSITA